MRRSPGGSLSGGGFFKQESFLEFDYAQGRWTYRIDEIAGAGVTDNVIDLMMRNIQRLSSKTQRILTLASCIGNPFGLQTLAIVSEQTPEEVAYDLRGAINEGLILTSGDCGSRIADCGLEVGSAIRSAQAVARNPQSAIRDPQSYSFTCAAISTRWNDSSTRSSNARGRIWIRPPCISSGASSTKIWRAMRTLLPSPVKV